MHPHRDGPLVGLIAGGAEAIGHTRIYGERCHLTQSAQPPNTSLQGIGQSRTTSSSIEQFKPIRSGIQSLGTTNEAGMNRQCVLVLRECRRTDLMSASQKAGCRLYTLCFPRGEIHRRVKVGPINTYGCHGFAPTRTGLHTIHL